jgi:hypothetical protein
LVNNGPALRDLRRFAAPVGNLLARYQSFLRPTTSLDNLNDTELVLWRFRMAGHEATVVTRGLNKVGNLEKIPSELFFAITQYALLVVAKFIEVWNDFGSLAPKDDRVVPARRALQPLVSRIQVWKGFEQHRNTTLAHAYLDSRGKPVPPWIATKELQAPTYHPEIILLLQLVVIANLCLAVIFAAEFRTLDPLSRAPSEWTVQPGPGVESYEQIEPVLAELRAEVDGLIAEGFPDAEIGDQFRTLYNKLGLRP